MGSVELPQISICKYEQHKTKKKYYIFRCYAENAIFTSNFDGNLTENMHEIHCDPTMQIEECICNRQNKMKMQNGFLGFCLPSMYLENTNI